MEIKELTKKDIAAAIDLDLSIVETGKGKSDPYHDVQKWRHYLDDGGILLGAFVNSNLIGYLMSRRESKRHFHVWMGGIKPEFRRRSLMTKLLEVLENRLKKEGYRRLTVNTYEKKISWHVCSS